ncbi:hypothetical protein Tco_0507774, partial [Tanacetum coccineum]
MGDGDEDDDDNRKRKLVPKCIGTGSSVKGKKEKVSDNGEAPKEAVHVRARRDQATDSHSIAKRVPPPAAESGATPTELTTDTGAEPAPCSVAIPTTEA